jgi:hypothetical protein
VASIPPAGFEGEAGAESEGKEGACDAGEEGEALVGEGAGACDGAHHPNDPKDASGRCLLEARSFEKVQPMYDAIAYLMPATDSGKFIALDDGDDNNDEWDDGGD